MIFSQAAVRKNKPKEKKINNPKQNAQNPTKHTYTKTSITMAKILMIQINLEHHNLLEDY